MAHDIRAAAAPGKTLMARLYQGAVAVGGDIALVESAQPGWYTAAVPSGTPAGEYQVLLLESGVVLDAVALQWDGAFEVTLPQSPTDVGVCRVYGYVESIDNGKAVANLSVEITLGTLTGVAASERIIAGRSIKVTTDAQGRILGKDGNPWIDLQRNDLLEPAGSYYTITSTALGVTGKKVFLTTQVADLRALLLT